MLDARSWRDVVNRFKTDVKWQERVTVLRELDTLLSARMTEDKARTFLFDQLHCDYDPVSDGSSALGWLREVANLLRNEPAIEDTS